MKVAVIGAGAFGGAFAKAALAAGHDVSVTARHQEHAEKVAADTGATARANQDAVDWADVVVLAIPGLAAAEWADVVAARLNGKILIDATNPINAQMSDTFTMGTSHAESLQRQLPEARVVKAFNTILASRVNAPRNCTAVGGLPAVTQWQPGRRARDVAARATRPWRKGGQGSRQDVGWAGGNPPALRSRRRGRRLHAGQRVGRGVCVGS